MIDEIQVQNLALIREATLTPSRGLTVLTGETGAGKTALLSALKLLMGARASADMVRDGENGLVVSGRFYGLGDAVASEAPEEDAFATQEADDETVVVRKVGVDGRSRVSANGTMASVRELASLVAPSIDLCGQFEHQQLMRPATHVGLLDAWAGAGEKAKDSAAVKEDESQSGASRVYANVTDALVEYRSALASAKAASAELARIREAQEASTAKLDEARFALSRIDEVNPLEGEYEELQRDLELAEHAESLARATATARSALSDDAGALDALNTAAAALESVAHVDQELADMASSLREAGFILEDISAQARDYRDTLEFDPAELAAQQERYSAMQGLMRSFGPRMQDVFERRAEAAELVSLADNSDAHLRKAQAALDEAEAQLVQAADALDAAREAAAPLFASEVTEVMGRLQMSGAQLVCAQERLPRESWNNAGPSSFEFLYKPTASSQPRPLARIASGGEVSRVMLAVKVVLGNRDTVDTLVFDEVDAGVGGAVAASLASEIATLANTHQVIVVTHLAQVAVCADTHYIVAREGDETSLSLVDGPAREREIARMLSGSITEASLAHARELLDR